MRLGPVAQRLEQAAHNRQVLGSSPSRPIIVTPKTWIISDTHFGHDNIVRYCKRPQNHDVLMARNWKKLVKPDEDILHLGDVTIWYKNYGYWAKQVKKLPGRKFLIKGNHDGQWNDDEWLDRCGMTVVEPFQQNKIFFSHESVIEGMWEVNIHGHSHDHAPFKLYSNHIGTYYNASIEGMNYRPVRMRKILKEISENSSIHS